MNHEHVDAIKVAFANLVSWATTAITIVKLQEVGAIVGIMAGLGSISVSVFSVLWIRKQMARSDAERFPPTK